MAGALLVLMHECGAKLPPDKSLVALVASDVPPGSGVSSSAALEVAAMAAFAAALGLDVPAQQQALLCQMVGCFGSHWPVTPSSCEALHMLMQQPAEPMRPRSNRVEGY